jgi:hypothetical protein
MSQGNLSEAFRNFSYQELGWEESLLGVGRAVRENPLSHSGSSKSGKQLSSMTQSVYAEAKSPKLQKARSTTGAQRKLPRTQKVSSRAVKQRESFHK